MSTTTFRVPKHRRVAVEDPNAPSKKRRRKLPQELEHLDFLDADTRLPGPSTFSPPSSDLLKCIHHYASSYYSERGQLFNDSRTFRKERKRRRLAKKARLELGSDAESEQEEPPKKMVAPASAKERRKDMYKTMDGSALLAIGMLLQEHIAHNLAARIPVDWEEAPDKDPSTSLLPQHTLYMPAATLASPTLALNQNATSPNLAQAITIGHHVFSVSQVALFFRIMGIATAILLAAYLALMPKLVVRALGVCFGDKQVEERIAPPISPFAARPKEQRSSLIRPLILTGQCPPPYASPAPQYSERSPVTIPINLSQPVARDPLQRAAEIVVGSYPRDVFPSPPGYTAKQERYSLQRPAPVLVASPPTTPGHQSSPITAVLLRTPPAARVVLRPHPALTFSAGSKRSIEEDDEKQGTEEKKENRKNKAPSFFPRVFAERRRKLSWTEKLECALPVLEKDQPGGEAASEERGEEEEVYDAPKVMRPLLSILWDWILNMPFDKRDGWEDFSRIGPVVAGILGGVSAILLVLLAYYVYRRRVGRRKQKQPAEPQKDEPSSFFSRKRAPKDLEALPDAREASKLSPPWPPLKAAAPPLHPASNVPVPRERVKRDPIPTSYTFYPTAEQIEQRRRQAEAGYRRTNHVRPAMPMHRSTSMPKSAMKVRPAQPAAVPQPTPKPAMPAPAPTTRTAATWTLQPVPTPKPKSTSQAITSTSLSTARRLAPPPGLSAVQRTRSRERLPATLSVKGPRAPRLTRSQTVSRFTTSTDDRVVIPPASRKLTREELRVSIRQTQEAVSALEEQLSMSSIDVPPLVVNTPISPPNNAHIRAEVDVLRKEVERLQALLHAPNSKGSSQSSESGSEGSTAAPPVYTT
ncbi:hypothetical protein MKEN_01435400 [Mycena kentingensis (nom. inval.)]|nr:hypothetical protein MKEN_01435400 [Mycena kentingensis (nom. inval.)]